MKHRCKRLLSILLSLMLVLGLMSGMSLTAYADTDENVAKVISTSSEVSYTSFSEALNHWEKNTTLQLLKTVETSITISVSGNVKKTLDLNGCGIKFTGTSGTVIKVDKNADLEIKDSSPDEVHRYTVTDGLATVDDNATGDDVKTYSGGYITGGKGDTKYKGGGVYNSG